jgi:hypothetical protein
VENTLVPLSKVLINLIVVLVGKKVFVNLNQLKQQIQHKVQELKQLQVKVMVPMVKPKMNTIQQKVYYCKHG